MKFCLIIICKEKNETFWKWVWYPYTSKCTAIAHLYTHSMHSWRILFFVFASLMFIKLVLLLTSVIMHLSLFVSIVLLNLQTYYLVNHNITYFIFFFNRNRNNIYYLFLPSPRSDLRTNVFRKLRLKDTFFLLCSACSCYTAFICFWLRLSRFFLIFSLSSSSIWL